MPSVEAMGKNNKGEEIPIPFPTDNLYNEKKIRIRGLSNENVVHIGLGRKSEELRVGAHTDLVIIQPLDNMHLEEDSCNQPDGREYNMFYLIPGESVIVSLKNETHSFVMNRRALTSFIVSNVLEG